MTSQQENVRKLPAKRMRRETVTYLALCDRVQEFATLTSAELLANARGAKLDDAIRMDMEIRRRRDDSRRSERAGRGSCRWDSAATTGVLA